LPGYREFLALAAMVYSSAVIGETGNFDMNELGAAFGRIAPY
jgi:hypothetical protein